MVLGKIKIPSDKKSKEKKLLKKMKNKDKEAFIKAYDLYVDQIYRYIFFRVSSHDDACDLSSEVFLKTWNYILSNDLKSEKTLRALIYKIAKTSIIDFYRKKSNLSNIAIDDENNRIDIPDSRQDIKKQAEINSDFNIIENKLRELKDEYREIIILRFIDELTIGEIADIINKTKGNARVLIHRSLKALRELMDNDNNKYEQ